MQPIRSPSQLTLDISAAHFHLSRQSMDSGYASSMSSARLPADWMLSRMYENWKIADAAAQRLSADLRALEECESQLREARKRRDEKDKKRCVCCAFSRVRTGRLTEESQSQSKAQALVKAAAQEAILACVLDVCRRPALRSGRPWMQRRGARSTSG